MPDFAAFLKQHTKIARSTAYRMLAIEDGPRRRSPANHSGESGEKNHAAISLARKSSSQAVLQLAVSLPRALIYSNSIGSLFYNI